MKYIDTCICLSTKINNRIYQYCHILFDCRDLYVELCLILKQSASSKNSAGGWGGRWIKKVDGSMARLRSAIFTYIQSKNSNVGCQERPQSLIQFAVASRNLIRTPVR
jgi:hypothetical protein